MEKPNNEQQQTSGYLGNLTPQQEESLRKFKEKLIELSEEQKKTK